MHKSHWFLIELRPDSPAVNSLNLMINTARLRPGDVDGLISCDRCLAESAISAIAKFSLPKSLRNRRRKIWNSR
ncbi:MAG: hypothetical protein KME17_08125 [Cyanosarcina radialis HA8281-LM2]|nr:hypothetical protein [Cyanosarcina radialis HA8281-LM2]